MECDLNKTKTKTRGREERGWLCVCVCVREIEKIEIGRDTQRSAKSFTKLHE